MNHHDDAQADVAVLGLGAMGTALAQSLLAAGRRTVVWNRTPGGADDLIEAGARFAAEAADAVSSARLVLICAFLPIARGGIATTAGWLDAYAAQIDAGRHPGDDSTMATHVAAMEHLLEETVGAGVDTSVPAGFKALGDRATEAGLADRGYTALVDLFLADPAPSIRKEEIP